MNLRIAGLALGLLALPALAADKVVLRSGDTVEGTVVETTDDVVVLQVGDATRSIPRRLVERVERDAAAPGAAGAKRADDPQVAGVDVALLARLADASATVRGAAMDAVVLGWPGTAPTLDAALRHADPVVRREAVSLLDRKELGDVGARVRAAITDPDAAVRALAIRQVRIRKVDGVEPVLARLLVQDPVVMVRFEALRTLEDVGTPACLDAVLTAWCAEPKETEKDRRRRYLRVLKKLTGEDAGSDRDANRDAWRIAIEAAVARGGPKPAPKDPEAPAASGTEMRVVPAPAER